MIGKTLAHYEITRAIGKGGMGEVYQATDARLDRTVAIKVLPEHLADDPKRRERFEREARAVSSLNHPHICTLHDIGEADGIHYIVMEYVEGSPRQPAGEGTPEARPGAGVRHPDRRRPRQSAPTGCRPSEPETRQHHVDPVGREASGLRPGEA